MADSIKAQWKEPFRMTFNITPKQNQPLCFKLLLIHKVTVCGFESTHPAWPFGKAESHRPLDTQTQRHPQCLWIWAMSAPPGLTPHGWSLPLLTTQELFNTIPFSSLCYLLNFRYYLTSLSGFFSTFFHNTFSLSVSSVYLDFGEMYHHKLTRRPIKYSR